MEQIQSQKHEQETGKEIAGFAEPKKSLAKISEKRLAEKLNDTLLIMLDSLTDPANIGEKEKASYRELDKLAVSLTGQSIERIHKEAIFSDEKAFQEIMSFLPQDGDSQDKALAISCLDTPEVWKMREELLAEGDDDIRQLVWQGLAGIDTDQAWDMRSNIIQNGWIDGAVYYTSTAGLDSERAWEFRINGIDWQNETQSIKDDFIESMAGLDSERAWELRTKLIAAGASPRAIVESLLGIDTERSWELRKEVLKDPKLDKRRFVELLAGLDSETSWQVREELLAEGVNFSCIAYGLAGLDSAKAWEMRDRLLVMGANKKYLAFSLAGILSERASALRRQYASEIEYRGDAAQGVSGSFCTALGWRAAKGLLPHQQKNDIFAKLKE